MKKTITLLLLCAATLAGNAQVPTIITYQGRLSAAGTNFTGTGQFKFAFLTHGTNMARQAAASVTLTNGSVANLTVTDPGAGYTTAPAVIINTMPGPPPGSGAVINAHISGGAVTGFTIGNPGHDYFSCCTFVTIAPPPPEYFFTSIWSDSGSTLDGIEPIFPVSVPVTDGLFTVHLGDPTVTAQFDSSIFASNTLWLRIWFSANGTNYQQLTPDHPLNSAPYAQMASRAGWASEAGWAGASKEAERATSFLGLLSGDVTGPQDATVVSRVGRLDAETVAAGANAANAATSANVPGTIVARDGAGNFAAGNINANFVGGNHSGNGSALTNLNGGNVQNSSLTAAKIASGQVVKSFNGLTDAVTLSAGSNVTFTTVGNTVTVSSAARGFVWQVASGTNVLAQPNTGYVVTNNLSVTLPPAPNMGDVVRLSCLTGNWRIDELANVTVVTALLSGTLTTPHWVTNLNSMISGWTSVASSDDGTKLVAVEHGDINLTPHIGLIYVSTDSGATWTPRESSRDWRSVASSSDGSKLVSVVYSGQIYTSADSGTNWTARAFNTNWVAVASSADGNKLVAANQYGRIYTSTDAGTNWTARGTNDNWTAVASSADGVKFVAVSSAFGYAGSSGFIFTSTDSGVTWKRRDSSRYWCSVASSVDGSKLVALDGDSISTGNIYTSTDSGTNWIQRDSARHWNCVASSSDGSKLVAMEGENSALGGQAYTSTDSGATWTGRVLNTAWVAVASSSDGRKLIAADHDYFSISSGHLLTSTDYGVTWTPVSFNDPPTFFDGGYIGGGANTAIELQYMGGGKYMPISILGTVTAH